ncbi:MAG: DUF2330 domain-containing protein [Methylobacteriaceae bacterium]|nr:DUF2330 domain-containing protein [Methylobacteriaceae bacterium]
MSLSQGCRNLIGSAGTALCLAGAIATPVAPALAFCGFYVAQADSKLFNKSSKVVLAWDSGRASVTMASDYEGDPKEFALVVPVPTVVKERDIRVVDNALVDKLDAYSAPRLTEYFDRDPCEPVVAAEAMPAAVPPPPGSSRAGNAEGVTIEARYEVGVYDILILSAQDSSGLVAWLKTNDYRIPGGAEGVLGSYIRQGMHFFVAKVNLERQKASDGYLRPLQVSYETRKFMLPIRLGTVNANGPQDLIVFVLSRKGRVETSNYQTAKMPSGMAIPLFAKSDFGSIYKAAFDTRVEADGMSKVYMEYGWDMSGYMPCDPCSAAVPNSVDLFTLGARWHYPQFAGASAEELKTAQFAPGPLDAYLTRLHVRYTAQNFPEDLAFTETRDREPFQAIYKLTHPAKSTGSCEQGRQYLRSLPQRFAVEARNLARLTGWSEVGIRARMEKSGQSFSVAVPN